MNNEPVTFEDFLLRTPLYKACVMSGAISSDTIDCYCDGCKQHSIFKPIMNDPTLVYINLQKALKQNTSEVLIGAISFECSRDSNHPKLYFVLLHHSELIQKIGQYPSLADLSEPDLKKYRRVLGDERFKDLVRGTGLATHGIGIGAFVYLRRIFEFLIEIAHGIAKQDPSWDDQKYISSRMDEKILLLKGKLPEFLITNRSLYGILSKGIHELSEDVCLEAFPVVRLGIQLILDEQLASLEREKLLSRVSKDISALRSKLEQ